MSHFVKPGAAEDIIHTWLAYDHTWMNTNSKKTCGELSHKWYFFWQNSAHVLPWLKISLYSANPGEPQL